MGFTFDAPISMSYSAYDKANKKSRRGTPLPSSKTERKPVSPTEVFANIRKSFRHSKSISAPQTQVFNAGIQKPPPQDSPFLKLPLKIREKIYSYVVGHGEVIHILVKRKASRDQYIIGSRRCRAGGNGDDCTVSECKQFCDIVNGAYFGSFDSIGGLLLVCRDIYREASQILYGQNKFSFDAPLSLLLLTMQSSPQSLRKISSISLDLEKYLYDPKFDIRCRSFHSSQWAGCWELIGRMEGLEEIKVNFQSPIGGWMGWSKEEVLDPLFMVRRPLKVFEVEAPASSPNTPEAANYDETENEAPFTLVSPTRLSTGW